MEDPRSRAPGLPQNGSIDRRDSFIFIITLMAQLSMLELPNIPRSSATDKKIWDELFEVEDEEWVMVDEEDPERGEAYEVFIDVSPCLFLSHTSIYSQSILILSLRLMGSG